MNLFNMLNCRIIESKEERGWWVFGGIFDNWWFLIVWLAELNVQCLMVGYDINFFQTTALTLPMHLTALGLGVGSLVVAAIAKSCSCVLGCYPTLEEAETKDPELL